jgi:hypothetical protein
MIYLILEKVKPQRQKTNLYISEARVEGRADYKGSQGNFKGMELFFSLT